MKKPSTRDRGEYRPWFAATIDDPAFAALDPFAFKVLFTLKASLTNVGIGMLRPANLMDALACNAQQLEHALQLLEAPKPGSSIGWIMREGKVVWIVNGLHFTLGLSPKDPKHRAFVKRVVAGVGDSEIVDRFRHYYKEWLGSAPASNEGASKAHERGKEGPSEHKRKGEDTTPDLNTSSSRARARELIPEKFRSDFDELLDRVPNEDAWATEISAAPTGLNGGAGAKPPSWDQIGQAIRDYNANGEDANLAHFRGYLRRSTAEPKGGSVRPGKHSGPRDYDYSKPTNSAESVKWAK